MAGAFTVAVICWKLLGVDHPVAGPTWIVVTPGASGSKPVLKLEVPALNTRGETVIVPVAGSLLVTGTLADIPPRIACGA